MAHLEEAFNHELHGDDQLNLPKNKRSLISLTKIRELLDNGDQTLLHHRFTLGRENDVHNLFGLEVEKLDLHNPNPYSWDLSTLYIKSKNAPLSQAIIDMQTAYHDDGRITKMSFSSAMNSGWDNDVLAEDLPESLIHARNTLNHLYKLKLDSNDNIHLSSPDETNDDIVAIQLFLNKDWNNDTKFRDVDYFSTNNITLLDNAYVSNDREKLKYLNRNRRFSDIIDLWFDKEYKNIEKEFKHQMYSTYSGIRPDMNSYHTWNGFQVFDLDMKNSPTPGVVDNIENHKAYLHNLLSKYNWYIGITYSSSRTGLHVYTKVSKPHHMFDAPTDNEELMKYWFRMNYLHKYAVIRYHLVEDMEVEINNTFIDPVTKKSRRKDVIDFAMARITQGIKVADDNAALINANFYDLPLMYTFHQGPQVPLLDWLLHPSVVDNKTFKAWSLLYSQAGKESDPYTVFEAKRSVNREDIKVEYDGENIRRIDGDINYNMRWNVCNTMAAVLGEDGRKWVHYILRTEETRSFREVDSMYNSAMNNAKEPTEWGLQIMRKCGFNVVLTAAAQEIVNEKEKNDIINLIRSGADNIDKNKYDWNRTLDENGYLGHLSDELLTEFDDSKVNLVIAQPGAGKTEWVKELAKKYRVLLVLPFVSVIDAKVMKDNDLGEYFDSFTGDKSLDKIKKGRSAVMTVDKFGNMDFEKYGVLYDYVIVDESHLTFISSYRIEAMSKALRKIKQMVANKDEFSAIRPKLIMMTGTVTGELAYFGYYNKLKTFHIGKNTSRKKEVKFVVCADSSEQQYLVSKHISNAIQNGIKILYPTNQGDVQAVKLIGMVEHLLGRPIKWGYYKKSNWNSELNEQINDHATIKDFDLILASNYLSVGIDIKDTHQFECIYDDSFMAHEIEQFNCRLRRVDIASTIYIPLKMANGDINQKLLNTQGWSLEMDRNDRDLIRDFMDIAETKMRLVVSFDPITGQMYTPGIKFENGKIIFDLEEHELTKFEERFNRVMSTPYFMARTLAEYGYKIDVGSSEDSNKTRISEVLGAGLEAAKIESDIQNTTMIETITWMVDNNQYTNQHGAVVQNFISGIFGENGTKITEDKNITDIKVEEDFLGNITEIKVPNIRIFNEAQPIAARFMSLYCADTAYHLFTQCLSSSGKIVKAEVERYMRLIQLVRNEERGNVGEEIYSLIRTVYDMIENNLDTENSGYGAWFEPAEYEANIDAFTQYYLDQLKLKLRTDKTKKAYRDEVAELFNVLTIKRRKNKGIILEFRLLPTPDNELRTKKKEFDKILQQIFEISDTNLPSKLKESIRSRHLSKEQIAGLEALKSDTFVVTA